VKSGLPAVSRRYVLLALLANIVIADITIHNANVFYELGIRHSLRDRKTILLKCRGMMTPLLILQDTDTFLTI
jgi:hypothetical protein